jgi:hypothetical protein
MSEAAAERLYGPAPEGDEDPAASQAVPDPGESPSYVNWPFAVALLNSTHLGRNVRLTDGKTIVTGQLLGVKHWAGLVSDRSIASSEESYLMGQRSTRCSFTRGFVDLRPEALVELLD